MKNLLTYAQYFLPKQQLSILLGRLAESEKPWLKNLLIKNFIKRYQIDMSDALIEDPEKYQTFNSFFTRQLKPALRPIVSGQHQIACPVDGTILQMGQVRKNQLLQTKDFYFNLEALLGGDSQLAHLFYDGHFSTLYLAPYNYHRVHMPLKGKLEKMIYVPGKLFSVNRITSELIPNLYSRNERLINLFQTEAGQMAVVMIGAMIVGYLKTTWLDTPVRTNQLKCVSYTDSIELEKGDELGYFKMGSTVVVLFQKDRTTWSHDLTSGSSVLMGQALGEIS